MKFDDDFVGRAALEAEVANPTRTAVTLRWGPEDAVDIYASPLEPGEAYRPSTCRLPPWSRRHEATPITP